MGLITTRAAVVRAVADERRVTAGGADGKLKSESRATAGLSGRRGALLVLQLLDQSNVLRADDRLTGAATPATALGLRNR